MTIAFSNLGASANPDINSDTDATSYANSSWTPPTSELICVFVSSRVASGTPNQPTGSGNGVTWTAIASVAFGVLRITLFGAPGSGSSAGATTFDFAGQTQVTCRASFLQATGVDLFGGVAAAFVQAPTNGTTALETTGTVTLAAVGAAGNRPIAGFAHNIAEATTFRANWTELDDLFVTNNLGLESQYRADAFETTASATWATAAAWAGIAAELRDLTTAPWEMGLIPILT